jgi:hypothetical protein
MTNSFTQLRTTYLDCRDGEGYPVLGCTERKELERLVEQRLRHIEGGTRRSDFQVQQDAERIVGACLVVTGQACVQQEVTIRSDWDAAARSGAVNQALWFSGIALISLLIGPMAWSLGAATVRRLWR